MKYLMTICYDGKDFCGFQTQPDARTVQGEIEQAMQIYFRENIIIFASGRTDSGVHAIGQVAHFDVNAELNLTTFLRSINALLPSDITITDVCKTNIAHARKDAKQKTYLYKFYVSDFDNALYRNRLTRIFTAVDIDKMKMAAAMLCGTHDFKFFSALNSSAKTTIRTIFESRIERIDDQYHFYITGNGFLYKMVRNIIGALIMVGQNKLLIDDFKKAIQKEKELPKNITMPPHGLYLLNVKYV